MGACPPPKEHSDYLSLSLHWSMGPWGVRKQQHYILCPVLPICAQLCCKHSSITGVFTYPVKQVQPPDQCNVYTHRNHPFPGLSSFFHSLPLAVLPNRYLLASLPLIAQPLSLPFSFHSLCSLPLSTLCDVLIWGTGGSLFPAPCQLPAPSLQCTFLQLQSTSKCREIPLPREPLLQIHPPRAESEAASASCQSLHCSYLPGKVIQTSQTTKRPPGYCAIFVVTFWVQLHTEPIIPCSVLTH